MAAEAFHMALTAYGPTLFEVLMCSCKVTDRAPHDQGLNQVVHGTCCTNMSCAVTARGCIETAVLCMELCCG